VEYKHCLCEFDPAPGVTRFYTNFETFPPSGAWKCSPADIPVPSRGMTVTIPVPSRGMTVTSIDPDWANHTSDPKIKLTYGRSQRGPLFQMLSGNTTTFRRAGYVCYGVATISRLLKIIGLFCKRALYKRRYSAKETYDFKEPTNRSHPICKKSSKPLLPQMCHQPGSAVSSAMRLRKFSIGFALSR